MSKAAQPRPPPAEVRCSRARVGSGSAARVGLGAAAWAQVVPGCLPPQTSLCWAGRARCCGGRAPRAVWTGTGCLACTSHAEASLLFAFLPLSLLELSPSRRDAARRAGIPASQGLPRGWEPWPPRLPPLQGARLGCEGSGLPRRGIKVPLSLLASPAQNLCFVCFTISLFYYFLMLALGLLTWLPCSLIPCLWSSLLLPLPAPIKASRSKSSWFFLFLYLLFLQFSWAAEQWGGMCCLPEPQTLQFPALQESDVGARGP